MRLRSRIIGWNAGGKLRYRHSESKRCSCKQRTVNADIVEDDFYRLIKLLQIPHDAIDMIAEIAVQSRFNDLQGQDEPFLVMRAALYEDQMGEEMKNRFNSGSSSDVSFVDPNGLWNPMRTLFEFRYRACA